MKSEGESFKELELIQQKLDKEIKEKSEIVKAHRVELQRVLAALTDDHAKKLEQIMGKM